MVNLTQKYNPSNDWVWQEDGELVGCMLGQLAMVTSHSITVADINIQADTIYKDIKANCRYPNVIIDFSDGSLMHRWVETPNLRRHFYLWHKRVMAYLQERFDMDITYTAMADYKNAYSLEILENVEKRNVQHT
jgi:hypothetical protein